ncbi:MAG: amidase [Alphaproteobacteria bacterium]|nr:amidase [Alphaproteobacteria bacterium]
MTDLHAQSIHALVAGLQNGSLTATDIVRSCLDRIDAREETVKAWQYLDREKALAQAEECDRNPASSPLHGIPVGLKDIIDTADMPTTYGSPIYTDHQPTADAICVQRLRAAGAVILGKTVTTQFAHRTPGKTTNPHNSDHTPGGSSSGSAAAVADGMAALAFGTQTSGSVIRPAAYCGVVGFKPSYNWTDFTGVKHLSSAFDTLGYYVRSLDDLPHVHAVLGTSVLPGADDAPDGRPSFALCRTPAWDEADAAAQGVLEEAAEGLSKAGASVRTLDLAAPFTDVYDAHTTVMEVEMVQHLADERENHWDMISPPTQDFITAGLACPEEKAAQARYTLDQARSEFQRLIGDDIVITLSAPGEAPRGLDSTGNPVFNRLWTSLRVPCLHLPVTNGPQGLPLGVTLAARKDYDPQVVAAGRWAAERLDLPLFG